MTEQEGTPRPADGSEGGSARPPESTGGWTGTPRGDDGTERAEGRSILRIAVIVLASVTGAVVVLLLLFVLALQTNWGGTHFADFLVTIANPYTETATEYGELRGNFITRLELRDLRMYRIDTVYVDTVRTSPLQVRHVRKDSLGPADDPAAFDTMYVDTLNLAVIDTFRMRYNLLHLLRREVHLNEIYFSRPTLTGRQRPDSTWDLARPFARDTAEAGQALFTFHVEELRIDDGELTAIYFPPSADSVFRVRDWNVRASRLDFTETVNASLDTLYASYSPPGQEDWTVLRAGGSLHENALDVRGLEIRSARSLVTAAGRLQLPSDEEEKIEHIDFELTADPIAFRDLHPFVSTLNADRQATLSVRTGGSSRLLNVDASGELGDGGSFSLSGMVSPTGEGPVRYSAEGTLRAFDPGYFTGTGEPSTFLNASLEVDLAGTDLQRLNGTARADLLGSTVAGVELASARLSADFNDGRADLDLVSTWNGSTVTGEGYIRPFDDLPAYDIAGQLRNVNLGDFGAGGVQSDVNAAFTIEGFGLNARSAEFDAELRVARSAINNFQMDSGLLQIELAGGDLYYGARVLFPEGLVTANGSADLGSPLTFSVDRGRFENFDLAALLGQDRPSSLNGRFALDGVGSDPQRMELNADLQVEPSTYGAFRLQEGQFRVGLNGGRMNVAANAQFEEAGRFDFAAVTRPFDDNPTVQVTRGEFVDVDLAAFMGPSGPSTDLSGTARFSMRGFDPATMYLDGSVSLSPSRINEQQVRSASAEFNLSRGTLSFDTRVDLPDGGLRLAGTALPFRQVPTYDVSQGEFTNIDLAALTGNPNFSSRLSGSLSIAGTGFDPETMDVEGRIDLSPSRLNEQQIESASVEGRLAGGTFDVDLALSVPEGDTRISGTFQPFLETPEYAVTRGNFAGIDVGALLGRPDLQTNLAGEVSLSGRGLDPESLAAEGTVRLGASRINDVEVSQGTLSGSLRDGLADFEASLAFADGSARVMGEGRFFDERPTYALDGTLSNVNVADLIGSDTLIARVSGAFQVEGSGTDPRTMDLRGLLASDDASYEGAEVDTLFTRFQLSEGVLSVDSLLLASSAVDARGAGVIALYDTTAASDFHFTADLKHLRPIQTLVAAENLQLESGFLEGRVYGRPGTLRFDASGRLQSFAYDDVRLAEFEGTLAGEFRPGAGLTIAEVQGTMLSIGLPQFFVERADLNVVYRPGAAQFSGTFAIDRRRTGEIAGFVETAPEARRVVLERMNLHLDTDDWELLQQATVTYGDEIRIRNFLLYSDDQQIAVDGVIDPDGQQNLVLTIENFRMDAVTDVVGFEGLGGTLNGSLMLTGPAEAPDMTGTLNADLSSEGRAVGDLRLSLDYDELRLNLDAVLTHVDGSTLTAEGFVPLDLRVAGLAGDIADANLSEGDVELNVVADAFSINWITPFLDPETVDDVEGRLSANIQVGGTMGAPILDGAGRLTDGRLDLAELGVTYGNISADFEMQRNQVEVANLRMQSGNGEVRGSGTVDLPQLTLGEFDVDLRADEFLAIDSREYRFVVNGDMTLSGTTRRPVLEGDVDVVSGEILLTDETTSPDLEQVQLTLDQIQTVERRFGIHVTERDTSTFNLYNALAMNLDVSIERNTWVRSRINPVMDIQFSGDLDLIKDHYSDVSIFGTIEVVPQRSRIVQFGRRFDITSGTLTFQGPATDPFIDVQAEYEVRTFGGPDPDVTITLGLRGRMSEQLDLELGSNQGLAYTDIVSYIATGRPASASLQLGGAGGEALIGTGAGVALGQLTAIMEGVAEAGLGLDVVTIEQSQGQTRLTAGSYVTPRLFVSVSQPITDPSGPTGRDLARSNRPMFTVEYEIQNWLLAQLAQRNQIIQLNLQFEYSY